MKFTTCVLWEAVPRKNFVCLPLSLFLYLCMPIYLVLVEWGESIDTCGIHCGGLFAEKIMSMYVCSIYIVELLTLSFVLNCIPLKHGLCSLLRLYKQKEKRGPLSGRAQAPLHLSCKCLHLKRSLLHVIATQAHPIHLPLSRNCLESTGRASLTQISKYMSMDFSRQFGNRDKDKHREIINLITNADCTLKRGNPEIRKGHTESDAQVTRKEPQIPSPQHAHQNA